MPLSDVQIRGAKPFGNGVTKLSDGAGLQLWITPPGSKLWNLAFRHEGRQRKLSPILPPASRPPARRDAARRLLASGIDPGQHRKPEANTTANTLGLIADAGVPPNLLRRHLSLASDVLASVPKVSDGITSSRA